MKILFVSAEAAPFIKTGGLGDVAGALPAALAECDGCEVSVILPLYGTIKEREGGSLSLLTSFCITSPLSEHYVGVFTKTVGRVTYYFIDNEFYFRRAGGPYGHGDDGARFVFFSHAVLEMIGRQDALPDILHLNDWQSAAVAILLRAHYATDPRYARLSTVFTIHNVAYQGKMPAAFGEDCMGLSPDLASRCIHDGCFNLMKGGILCADRVTTVSRTYAEELRYAYFSHGLDGVLRSLPEGILGIVNGIDTEIYNPKKDKHLPARYSADDLSGKTLCKRELQRELGLPIREDVPVFAIVSRLVAHKGMSLFACVLENILAMDIQMVVLGTGDGEYEAMFREAEARHPDRLSVRLSFDTALASRIYGGSDFFLMPSESEPCGLSQQIAMRYGTVPVVRETGGLYDTVPALNPATMRGRGFTFHDYDPWHMLDAVCRAVAFYGDTENFNRLRRRLLRLSLGWRNAAGEYISLYRELLACNTEKQKTKRKN